ncbi:hypothetical protein RU97_GL000464 [Enterococcus canis]|uniref:Uncharacterized protein n=1 Tax=Enterococcus canis TaxID=214095 RepID=A0A1L8RKC6_9ENTE|nr:hypothetical protein [Enterococcus canis]OJG20231.1 hypothetical protein RU97_GL000464 [Enterococcus canis]
MDKDKSKEEIFTERIDEKQKKTKEIIKDALDKEEQKEDPKSEKE